MDKPEAKTKSKVQAPKSKPQKPWEAPEALSQGLFFFDWQVGGTILKVFFVEPLLHAYKLRGGVFSVSTSPPGTELGFELSWTGFGIRSLFNQ